MKEEHGRTKRARLHCRNCGKETVHYFSHSMCVEERKRGVSGTYVDRSRDLWYKCQSCMSMRRWGQEHLSSGDSPSSRKNDLV